MKLCLAHWDGLRKAIEERGLFFLVAGSDAEMGRRFKDELENGLSPTNFDPLFFAHCAIIQNSLRAAGLKLFGHSTDGGEICPLCYLRRPEWVTLAADEALSQARKFKLVEAP